MCTYRRKHSTRRVQHYPQFQASTGSWNVPPAGKGHDCIFKGVGGCRHTTEVMQDAALVTGSYDHSEGLQEQTGDSYRALEVAERL